MLVLTTKQLVKVVGIPLLLLFGSYKIWSMGNTHGQNQIQNKWDAAEKIRDKAIQIETDLNAVKERDNRQEQENINHALSEQKLAHANELAAVKYDYADRLRKAEQRSSLYKRQAESGTSECRNLAGYAAELDRNLEEGRSLVRELRETLRFRDEQIQLISDKLLSDRKLLTQLGESHE